MNGSDRMRTITAVEAHAPASLRIRWSDGVHAEIDLSNMLSDRRFRSLRTPAEFAAGTVGEWGHGVAWPSGVELGADSLWLETLSATGHDDARTFLEWRLRHGLSLSATATALGVSRRMVAYYSNGEKKIPRAILLACKGWEAGQAAA
ncbi:MAG TPA: DUF2442 domain-containing protein [Caulobacteraceae bacterium]|nr:DUF2442 domain-containing protein [Caulobacteraceae bacterium]